MGVLLGETPNTPFVLSGLSYVKRRSPHSREKMPLEPQRKNGSCEIRIEKEKQKRRLAVSTLRHWSFQGRPTSSDAVLAHPRRRPPRKDATVAMEEGRLM